MQRLERLQTRAAELLGTATASITQEWTPASARDFAGEPADHTVCSVVSALLNASSATGQQGEVPQGTDMVFQINHCYVALPGAGDNILTNDGKRIWIQNEFGT